MRQSNNCIHRGSDLMSQTGKKFHPGSIQLFCHLFGRLKFSSSITDLFLNGLLTGSQCKLLVTQLRLQCPSGLGLLFQQLPVSVQFTHNALFCSDKFSMAHFLQNKLNPTILCPACCSLVIFDRHHLSKPGGGHSGWFNSPTLNDVTQQTGCPA